MNTSSELADESIRLAREAVKDVEHLHYADGTRILVTAAASTTLAIAALRAELHEQAQNTSMVGTVVHIHSSNPNEAARVLSDWVARRNQSDS